MLDACRQAIFEHAMNDDFRSLWIGMREEVFS
jgi:hypothetical protein